MMTHSQRPRRSDTDNNNYTEDNSPASGHTRISHRQNGSNKIGKQRRKNGLTPRKTHRSPQVVEEIVDPVEKLNETKLCIICGSAEETVDLTANPIMKQTMASYCDDDNVNLDGCLSSLCLTCVFKSRAVKEVQDKIKLRLHRLTNGQMSKASPNNLEKNKKNKRNKNSQQSAEQDQNRGAKDVLMKNPDMELYITGRSNGLYGSNPLSSNTIGDLEASEACLRLPTPPLSVDLRAQNFKSLEPPKKSPLLPLNQCHNIGNGDISEKFSTDQCQTPEDDSVALHLGAINDNVQTLAQTPFPPAENNVEISNRASSKQSSCSNSTQSLNGLHHSMLEVIRERSESVLITESGGKINNYKHVLRTQMQLSCQYCGQNYVRKDYYNKHIRRCRRRSYRSIPSLAGNTVINGETAVNVSVNRFRVNGANTDTNTTVESSRRTRRFHCSECLATMDSITELRQHRATHLREYNCDMCDTKFNTLHEHDFHRIVCLAKREAWQEQQTADDDLGELYLNDGNKSTAAYARSVTTTIPNRRVTRGQSSARTDMHGKRKVGRRTRAFSSLSRYTNGYTDDGNSDVYTCATENDRDDDVSVADSMDSRRRFYTDDWLDKRSSNDIYSLPPIQIDSEKEYDLYLLEKLKAQIDAQEFTCLTNGCDFFADTLLNMMLHDYVQHFKSSWFYCPKCGKVFTSKVFLDYHLDRQNGGRFICYKCNEQFMFQHQLDWHLILHSKQMNHACDNCKCEFLSEDKLNQHIKLEHSNEAEKKLICIQSRATFASSRLASECSNINGSQHARYTVKILNMHTPPMPSRRPMELPGHKPYRRHIGIIEFRNERNPNCCSCK